MQGRKLQVTSIPVAVAVAVVVVTSATIACGIDALGTRTDVELSGDERTEGGAGTSADASPLGDGSTTVSVDGEDGGSDAAVACSEDGGVRKDGHCYFPIAPTTQPLAKQACVDAGAHLVTVGSDAEHALLAGVGVGDRWIGLEAPAPTNDRAQYVWVTGEPKTVLYWYVNDPDNMGPCVALHGTLNEWVDRGCGDTNAALCERE